MDITEFWVQLLTVGGPMAIIAALSIYWNNKLMMRWIDRIEGLENRMAHLDQTHTAVAQALGEVTEALRRLNGKM